MVGYVIIGALAAFGLLCAVWLGYGLFRVREGGVVLLSGCAELGLVRRCLWLKEMGFLDCRLAMWELELSPGEKIWLESHGIEIWSDSRLRETFGIGAEENGSGTGDPSGRHQRRGLSEL